MSDCLGCQRIEVAPVVLDTGATVCNFCPSWKDECLKRQRHVETMRRMTQEARRAYINRVSEREGDVAAERTKEAYIKDWTARKQHEKQ